MATRTTGPLAQLPCSPHKAHAAEKGGSGTEVMWESGISKANTVQDGRDGTGRTGRHGGTRRWRERATRAAAIQPEGPCARLSEDWSPKDRQRARRDQTRQGNRKRRKTKQRPKENEKDRHRKNRQHRTAVPMGDGSIAWRQRLAVKGAQGGAW